MTKQLLTGQEIRVNAKQRLKKHREKMLADGLKTVSVFMGESLRGELKRLGETGLTRHGALEHIFNIYQKSMNEPGVDKPSIDSAIEPTIDIKGVTCNGNDNEVEPETASNDINLGDWTDKDMDVAAKDLVLIQLGVELPGKENAQRRVDILNQAGITSGKVPFNKKKFTDNVRLAKQRQARREV